jgi:hypothetical protein
MLGSRSISASSVCRDGGTGWGSVSCEKTMFWKRMMLEMRGGRGGEGNVQQWFDVRVVALCDSSRYQVGVEYYCWSTWGAVMSQALAYLRME